MLIYMTIINEKRGLNLKESQEYMEGLAGRKGMPK